MRLPLDKTTHKGYDFLDWAKDSDAYHPGVDLNRGGAWDDLGDPVYSFRNGIVVFTQKSSRGYGNMIIVKHSDCWSKYAHLKDIYVKKGDKVNTFQMIGTMGNTGASNAPHLHFEIIKSDPSSCPNFYPRSRSIDWVSKNYHNPNTYIKPKTLKVKIIANRCKWKTWEKKMKQLKDWFWKETNKQLKLEFDVIHVDVTEEWEVKGNGWILLNDNWVERVLYPKATGHDILMYVTERENWRGRKPDSTIGGYATDRDSKGIEFIALSSDEHTSDMRYGDKNYFFGIARHEICHTLVDMHNSSVSKLPDTVHEHDYQDPSNIIKSIENIEFESLIGWSKPGVIRLYKKRVGKGEHLLFRELKNTPMWRMAIKGFERAGFTKYIPK